MFVCLPAVLHNVHGLRLRLLLANVCLTERLLALKVFVPRAVQRTYAIFFLVSIKTDKKTKLGSYCLLVALRQFAPLTLSAPSASLLASL